MHRSLTLLAHWGVQMCWFITCVRITHACTWIHIKRHINKMWLSRSPQLYPCLFFYFFGGGRHWLGPCARLCFGFWQTCSDLQHFVSFISRSICKSYKRLSCAFSFHPLLCSTHLRKRRSEIAEIIIDEYIWPINVQWSFCWHKLKHYLY